MDKILKPSELQQSFYDAALNETGSIILLARAGCGKSSTLLGLVERVVEKLPRISIFVGAYNRPIANEFIANLRAVGIEWKNAEANTWHGAGLKLWRKVTGWTPDQASEHIDEKKCAKLFDAEVDKKDVNTQAKMEGYREIVLKLVDLAKQKAFGVLCAVDDRSKWFDIVDHFGLDENLPENADLEFAVTVAIWLYKRSLNTCRETIDFNDMILAPLFFKAPVRYPFDWVLIDEAQDTNPARRALALRMLKPGGRLIAVGDDRQAIYGFTGADADSLKLIQAAVNAKVMPLNVTYRCPKVAVRRAQRWVPDFQAHETAPEGIERAIFATPAEDGAPARPTIFDEKLTKDDAILCRNTKPLVELAYALLRRGIPCMVEGREIGNGLIALVNRWKAVNTAPLANKLAEYREKEVAKWMAKEKEQKAEEIADRVETILVLIQQLANEGKTRVSDLINFIDGMFKDTKEDPDGVKRPKVTTLATAHKSKGREWQRVYILGQAKYMPSKWARKDWQMEQEINLMYVATTRTKFEIVDIIVEG